MIKKEKKVRKSDFDLDWFLEELKNKTSGIKYLSGYRTYSRDKSVFECVKHGKYSTIPHLVLKRDGKGCPSCTELARRKPVCGVGNNDVLDYNKRDYLSKKLRGRYLSRRLANIFKILRRFADD